MSSTSLLLLRTSSRYYFNRHYRSISSFVLLKHEEQPLIVAKKCRLDHHRSFHVVNTATSEYPSSSGSMPWLTAILLSSMGCMLTSTSLIDSSSSSSSTTIVNDDTDSIWSHIDRWLIATSQGSSWLLSSLSSLLQRGHPHYEIDRTMISSSSSSSSCDRQKSYEVSCSRRQGLRSTLEDEYDMNDGGRFVAIYDGHGGSGVSQYLKQHLYHKLHDIYHPTTNTLSSQDQALRSAFADIEKEVINDRHLRRQGSTAVAVLLHESNSDVGAATTEDVEKQTPLERTIITAHVGDSRAVLSRNGIAMDLTRDHKPNDALEKERILGMGEPIEWDRSCRVHRVRDLSLSRSIGDYWAKPVVSSEVEIHHYPLLPAAEEEETSSSPSCRMDVDDDNYGCGYGDQFVVVASDGVWDVMTSQDVVQYVHNVMAYELQQYHLDYDKNYYRNDMDQYYYDHYKHMLRQNMAQYITQEAIKRGTGDNVSVVMVWLHDH